MHRMPSEKKNQPKIYTILIIIRQIQRAIDDNAPIIRYMVIHLHFFTIDFWAIHQSICIFSYSNRFDLYDNHRIIYFQKCSKHVFLVFVKMIYLHLCVYTIIYVQAIRCTQIVFNQLSLCVLAQKYCFWKKYKYIFSYIFNFT